MGTAAAIILVIGLPLTLIAIGFIILVNKFFGSGNDGAEREKTLETAQHLERALSSLENRLSALEDIILAGSENKNGGENNER